MDHATGQGAREFGRNRVCVLMRFPISWKNKFDAIGLQASYGAQAAMQSCKAEGQIGPTVESNFHLSFAQLGASLQAKGMVRWAVYCRPRYTESEWGDKVDLIFQFGEGTPCQLSPEAEEFLNDVLNTWVFATVRFWVHEDSDDCVLGMGPHEAPKWFPKKIQTLTVGDDGLSFEEVSLPRKPQKPKTGE